ncbi:MAG: ATP-binding protein [Chloroflexi bacterium]|nr:ATP-binding protein [Chloroflexota bacterium]
MQITRFYQDLEKFIKPNKVLVIYGSRQVGKTTLLTSFLNQTNLKYKLDSGDNIKTRQILGSEDFTKIKDYAADYELLAIDEAQRIPRVGQALKIIVDQIPQIRVIATGSSSFELSGQIGEPLTGRKKTITLFPIAQTELRHIYNLHELKENLPDFLIYGGYPAVVIEPNRKEKINLLDEIMHSYLLKDILELEKVKGSDTLLDLLRLLSFQIGSEVSLSEIGRQLGLDVKTVARYLDLLEKSFIIFKLRGYSRNLRKEITKKHKYYFFDNGIRNTVISNFNDLPMRDDVGRLWENFLVIERIKTEKYLEIPANNYFWRTWDKKEIDWIEERQGKLFGFEFKYAQGETKIAKDFLTAYPEAEIKVINQDNYLNWLGVR